MWRTEDVFYTFIFLATIGSLLACDVEIISREGWGARPAQHVTGINTPVYHVFIGHTVTPQCYDRHACSARMRQMQNYHMNTQGWPDIGYNFVIGSDGKVYEGVGWNREGTHTYAWNSKSYGIAFVGNFMTVRPSDAMLSAARKLIICGIKYGYIAQDRELHGARDATCTASPGDVLYEIIREWPRFKGGPLPVYNC